MDRTPPLDPNLIDSRLFEKALQLARSERLVYVYSHFRNDAKRADSVLNLLDQIDQLGSFLKQPASDESEEVQFADGAVLNGRYRILRLAGVGGMGEVYQAEDPLTEELVALKVCRRSLWANPEAVSRFKDEIRLARRVSHPNICRIREVYASHLGPSSPLFYSMDWLEGETLASLLASRGHLDSERVVRIACELASALDSIHALGIVHRDLKAANVFIVPEGEGARSVMTDFGLRAVQVRRCRARCSAHPTTWLPSNTWTVEQAPQETGTRWA